jgi:hypothetical protein
MAGSTAESPFFLDFLAATGTYKHKGFFPTNGDASRMTCQWADANIGVGLSRGQMVRLEGRKSPTPLYERGLLGRNSVGCVW